MVNRILIPTDFSSCADNAQKLALDIALKTKAEIHFLHSVNTIVDWGDLKFLSPKNAILPEDYKEKLFPEVTESLERVKQKLIELEENARTIGLKSQSHLVFNHAYQEIINFSTNLNIDLIIMGTHGSSGVKEIFIGSNTQKIVRLSTCPVFTVKDLKNEQKFGKIVYASDFNDKRVNKNLGKLNEFAKIFDAEVQLLFVNTPNNFEDSQYTLSKLEQVANNYGLENYSINIYNDYTIEDGIIAYCNRNQPDILSITIHGFKGLRRLINNNTTELLVNHIDIPVLSFNIDT